MLWRTLHKADALKHPSYLDEIIPPLLPSLLSLPLPLPLSLSPSLLPQPAIVISSNKWPLPQMNFYIRGNAVCSWHAANGCVSLIVLRGDRYTWRKWVYCSQKYNKHSHTHTHLRLNTQHTQFEAFRPAFLSTPLLSPLDQPEWAGCSNKILVPW